VVEFVRRTQRQISCERDESASVEKTVAFYRQIPSAKEQMHRELSAGSAE